jgi:pSer/pThr/pTyr-binding forkhead associated (FHA) protein
MLRIQLKFNNALLKEIDSKKEEISIGRNAGNDIQIDNLAVSGKHARIIKDRDHYYVEDLNSTNGTFVNEEKISKKILKENDQITIGKHTLIVALPKQGDKDCGQVNGIERTWMLETGHHKEILKRQRG